MGKRYLFPAACFILMISLAYPAPSPVLASRCGDLAQDKGTEEDSCGLVIPERAIKVHLRDADTGTDLSGGAVALWQWSREADQFLFLTKLKEEHTKKEVYYYNEGSVTNTVDNCGNYKIVESGAPYGYVTTGEEWSFSVREASLADCVDFCYQNMKTGSIQRGSLLCCLMSRRQEADDDSEETAARTALTGVSANAAASSTEPTVASTASAGLHVKSAGTSVESAGISAETSTGSAGTSTGSAGTSTGSAGTSTGSAGTSTECAETSTESVETSTEFTETSAESDSSAAQSTDQSEEKTGSVTDTAREERADTAASSVISNEDSTQNLKKGTAGQYKTGDDTPLSLYLLLLSLGTAVYGIISKKKIRA